MIRSHLVTPRSDDLYAGKLTVSGLTVSWGARRTRDFADGTTPGQDVISITMCDDVVVAVLCDGVSGSYAAHLAACEIAIVLSQRWAALGGGRSSVLNILAHPAVRAAVQPHVVAGLAALPPPANARARRRRTELEQQAVTYGSSTKFSAVRLARDGSAWVADVVSLGDVEADIMINGQAQALAQRSEAHRDGQWSSVLGLRGDVLHTRVRLQPGEAFLLASDGFLPRPRTGNRLTWMAARYPEITQDPAALDPVLRSASGLDDATVIALTATDEVGISPQLAVWDGAWRPTALPVQTSEAPPLSPVPPDEPATPQGAVLPAERCAPAELPALAVSGLSADAREVSAPATPIVDAPDRHDAAASVGCDRGSRRLSAGHVAGCALLVLVAVALVLVAQRIREMEIHVAVFERRIEASLPETTRTHAALAGALTANHDAQQRLQAEVQRLSSRLTAIADVVAGFNRSWEQLCSVDQATRARVDALSDALAKAHTGLVSLSERIDVLATQHVSIPSAADLDGARAPMPPGQVEAAPTDPAQPRRSEQDEP